mgnify:CR=1 FL=1
MDLRRIEIDLQNKKFAPIYILHGEEGYFIDKICQLIIDNALEDHERDFDQHIIYGKDAQLLNLAAELKAFPMIAQRRLVVIKEAQDFKELEKLESYASSPSPSSILVICCKYKTIRGNKKLIKNTKANGGIVFSSDKIKDYKLQEWVVSYIKKQGFEINSKAAMLLTEHIGNDLSRMINELNKLFVILKKGTNISDIDIQNNIGISKDYNVFELSNAVSEIDIKKANQIIHYFNNNPKAANTIVVVSSLFKLLVLDFSNSLSVFSTSGKVLLLEDLFSLSFKLLFRFKSKSKSDVSKNKLISPLSSIPSFFKENVNSFISFLSLLFKLYFFIISSSLVLITPNFDSSNFLLKFLNPLINKFCTFIFLLFFLKNS